jgi:hypothetical protein
MNPVLPMKTVFYHAGKKTNPGAFERRDFKKERL